MLFGTNEFVKISFRLVPYLEAIALLLQQLLGFMKQRRHIAYQGGNIEEGALARHSMAQDLKIAQQDLFLAL